MGGVKFWQNVGPFWSFFCMWDHILVIFVWVGSKQKNMLYRGSRNVIVWYGAGGLENTIFCLRGLEKVILLYSGVITCTGKYGL